MKTKLISLGAIVAVLALSYVIAMLAINSREGELDYRNWRCKEFGQGFYYVERAFNNGICSDKEGNIRYLERG